MRRLVFITQQVDPGHPALAATVPKIRALAARVDEVVVLADRALPGVLPDELPRAAASPRARRPGAGVRFEAALAAELARRPRPAAVVAHMCPIYAVLAAPLARPLGVPVAALVHALERDRGRSRRPSASRTAVAQRRPALVPDRLAEGASRSGTGSTSPSSPARDGGRRTTTCARVALGRYSRAKGLDDDPARRCGSRSTTASTCGSRCTGRR